MIRKRYVSSDSLISMVERKMDETPFPETFEALARVKASLIEFQEVRDSLVSARYPIPADV